LNDATLAEYGLMLALIAVVCMAEVTQVQPGLTDDACAIRAELQAGIAAIQPQAPPDPCATIIP
jgi:Flp pilus assembly pilin Flp